MRALTSEKRAYHGGMVLVVLPWHYSNKNNRNTKCGLFRTGRREQNENAPGQLPSPQKQNVTLKVIRLTHSLTHSPTDSRPTVHTRTEYKRTKKRVENKKKNIQKKAVRTRVLLCIRLSACRDKKKGIYEITQSRASHRPTQRQHSKKKNTHTH